MTAGHDTSSWESPASRSDARVASAIEAIRFRRVVVGVDGSPNSVAALRVAVGLAKRDGGTVDAICAFHSSARPQYPFGAAVPPFGPLGDGAHEGNMLVGAVIDADVDAHRSLQNAMNDAFGCSQLDGVELIAVVGAPHDVLTRCAEHADVLVVGACGHAGPLGMVLGSTAQACTRHAHCPVLVVPLPAHLPPS